MIVNNERNSRLQWKIVFEAEDIIKNFQSEVKTKLQRKRLKDMSRKLTEYWHIYPRQYVILLCFVVSIVTRHKNLFLDPTINLDFLFAYSLFFDK